MWKKKEEKNSNFIEKLKKFICNSKYFDWYEDNGFIIKQEKRNENNIIEELNNSRVFNGKSYASFKKQFNLYGIEIKDKTRNTKKNEKKNNIYVHKSIKLNKNTNFSLIKRKRKIYQFYKSNNIDIISEINKLKEEKLKEDNEKFKKLKEENKNLKKELKEENKKFKNILKKYEKLKKENINNLKKRKINNDSMFKNKIFKNNKNFDLFFENNYIEGMFDNYIDYSRNNLINDDFDNEFEINESHTETNIDFKKIGDMKINDPKDIDIDFIYSK